MPMTFYIEGWPPAEAECNMHESNLPLISCIVPVYNGERYLRETLDSIFSQTYRPLEIIVADDGSNDGTAPIVASYGDRIQYLKQENAGASAARNLGLERARGEFIAFLDADDLWHAEKLQRQMACFQARPDLELCITHVQNFWIPELAVEAEKYRDHRLSKPTPGFSVATLLAKRSAFDRIGRFDRTLKHADKTEWFLRARTNGAAIELLPDVLLYRRIHQTNVSRVLGDECRDEYLALIKRKLAQRPEQLNGRENSRSVAEDGTKYSG